MAKLWRDGSLFPAIAWEDFFPPDILNHWKIIRAWPIRTRTFPTKEEDKAAAGVADFFYHNRHILPFRVPTLKEKMRESELTDFYAALGPSKHILTHEVCTNLVGNFFLPSAVGIAFGVGHARNIQVAPRHGFIHKET